MQNLRMRLPTDFFDSVWVTGLLLAGTALVISMSTLESTRLGVFIGIGYLAVVFTFLKPKFLFYLFLILIPVGGTAFVDQSILPLPGAKPLNLLALVVIVTTFVHKGGAGRIPKGALPFAVVTLGLFALSFAASLPHLDDINAASVTKLDMDRYILSAFLKPVIFFIPFFVILRAFSKENDVGAVLGALVFSTLVLSLMIAFLYFKGGAPRGMRETADVYRLVLGSHRNELGTFYILAVPAAIARMYTRRNLTSVLSTCVILMSLALLYSRSAYFAVLFAIAVQLFLTKRMKWLPIAAGAVSIILLIWPTTLERASTGIGAGDADTLLAGRVAGLWVPLLREYASDPSALLFGRGRYAILSTEIVGRGGILQVDHPHNMFLEMVLDAGILALAVVMIFYFRILRQTYRAVRKGSETAFHDYHCAVLAALVGYLVSGMTDRSLFPRYDNGFLWALWALAMRMNLFVEERSRERSDAHPVPD
ncbi:MAG: O-antigen ligase family protein [bacterium]